MKAKTKIWRIAAVCSLLLLSCTAADPVRDQLESDSLVIRDATPAYQRTRAALKSGATGTPEDLRKLEGAWGACTRLAEAWPTAYDGAHDAGYQSAIDAYSKEIYAGTIVWRVIYSAAALFGLWLIWQFRGALWSLVKAALGRAALLTLLAGVALTAIPRAAPAATAPDPIQAKLVEVALRDQHSLRTLRALIAIESSWRPRAVSRSGAVGLTQLMPATARGECGLRVGPGADERFDPLKNIDCGSSYLRKMRARFGSLRLALVAYNTGPGTLTRRGVTPSGREYLRRFVAAGGVL
jgi:hypothetical protein